MTTSVTVETHNWPVQVTINQHHNHTSDHTRSNGYSTREEFVPKDTKRVFSISDSTSISFTELKADATKLPSYGDKDEELPA